MRLPTLVVLVLCCCYAVLCASANHPLRVLAVFPHPGRSHGMLTRSVVDVLLDAGHEVTYVSAHAHAHGPRRGLRLVATGSPEDGAAAGEDELELVKPEPLRAGAALAKRMLRHPAVQALLADRAQGFDVVVAEWFHSGLLAPVAAVFECPLVWYSASDVSWQSLRLMQETSHLPPHPFTLADQAHHLWTQLYLSAWIYYMTSYVEEPAYHALYGPALRARGREPPPYESLVLDASLLLVNSHPPLGQRLPLPQSVQYVGGHHLRLPPDPLAEDLQAILDKSKNGAIFISMGSNFKSKEFPESMRRELVKLLGQLEQTVLWQFEGELEHPPSNLHVLDWSPQLSILNHPNTILFISSGGPLSVMEATQFGVPVVGVPMTGEQFVTMDLAVARGCGIRVDFAPDLPLKIKEAVNEILGNFSYRSNSGTASVQFSERLAPAPHALVHWVQLAALTQGAPHLRLPAPPPPPLCQRLHLDLLLLLALAVWLLAKLHKVIRAHRTMQTLDSDKKDE